MKKEKILKKIASIIAPIDKDIKIWLYGSQARGDAKQVSDWDILIITQQKLDYKRKWKLSDPIYDLGINLGVSFSIFIYSTLEWEKFKADSFYKNVEKEKIPIL